MKVKEKEQEDAAKLEVSGKDPILPPVPEKVASQITPVANGGHVSFERPRFNFSWLLPELSLSQGLA